MVQGNAILVVDLGNSSTKATVMYGKNKKGLYRERTFELPNCFAEVEEDYEIPEEYSDSTSTVFEVDMDTISGVYCNGELQEREFRSTGDKPTAMINKYESVLTDLTINLTFIHAYKALSSIANNCDIEDIDVTWSVVTLLPPGDLAKGKAALEQKFKSVTYVKSVFPKIEKDLKITDVLVLPEGFCAYTAVVYDKGRKTREGYSFLKEQKVLVLDIGAGTTDCMIIENNKLISASRKTIIQGGNNVKQQVIRLCTEKGIHITAESCEKGMITGVVYEGAKEKNIVPAVNKAKGSVATSILQDFTSYLEGINLNLKDVGYVLVCGGGSMQVIQNKAILPLSTQIIEKIKRISPETLLVEIPTQAPNASIARGYVDCEEQPINARYLNLLGATIMAELQHQ